MTTAVDAWFACLNERLSQGSVEYGNQSMVRPVDVTMREVEQELIDQVGWSYIMWCQARRKESGPMPEGELRQGFLHNLRHRIERNDRSGHGFSLLARLTKEIEVLCLDMFEFHQQVMRRLHPIARGIEVAQAINQYPGRRGSTRDPRSDD